MNLSFSRIHRQTGRQAGRQTDTDRQTETDRQRQIIIQTSKDRQNRSTDGNTDTTETEGHRKTRRSSTVSYTHLTLPTRR